MAESKDKKTEAVENAAVDSSSSQAAGEEPTTASAEASADAPKKKAPAKKPAAKKPAGKTSAAKKPAAKAKASSKKDEEKAEAKSEEAAEEKAPAKKAPAKKTPAKKPAPKKPAAPAEPTYVRATARYVRSAPRKARLVVDHIRGESVEDARVFLQFTPRHVGRDVAKVLESAVANAEHNHELDGDSLHIVKAYVDEGPTLKRWRPRAKGRATQILKRTSHITVVVSDVPAKDLKNRKAAA